VKNSVARKIKAELQQRYPSIEANIDEMFPKKETMVVYKTKDKVQFLVVKGEAMFFSDRNGPFFPTLRLVHKCTSSISSILCFLGAHQFIFHVLNQILLSFPFSSP